MKWCLLPMTLSLLFFSCEERDGAAAGAPDGSSRWWEGDWEWSEGGGPQEMSIHSEYLIGTKSIEMDGYPPINGSARYRVLNSTGETAELSVSWKANDYFSGEEPETMQLTRNAETGTILIDGRGPYRRKNG